MNQKAKGMQKQKKSYILSFPVNQKTRSGAGSIIGGSGSEKERIGRGKSQ